MKIAVDFDNTLTNGKVFDFINDLLNEGIGVDILTSRIGHIKSDQNRDILNIVRDLQLPYASVIFTNDKKGYFANHPIYEFYLSDDMIDLQLCDKVVTCVPLFGNKNWKEDCLTALGELV